MVCVSRVLRRDGQWYSGVGEQLVVTLSIAASRAEPCVEMRQFCRQHRRLDAVHAAVAPDKRVLVLGRLAMVCDQPSTLGGPGVVGDDRSGVAIRTEILAGIKAKRSNV